MNLRLLPGSARYRSISNLGLKQCGLLQLVRLFDITFRIGV